jgi:hypothetical protein
MKPVLPITKTLIDASELLKPPRHLSEPSQLRTGPQIQRNYRPFADDLAASGIWV